MKALGYVFLVAIVILVAWAAFRAREVGEVTEPAQPVQETLERTETEAPPKVEQKPSLSPSPVPAAPTLKTHQVLLTAVGFSVNQLSVKRGETVSFTNRSGAEVRIPSNPHPIHTDLPVLDSGTLKDGQSYTFIFTTAGTFGVHNHFNPSQTISITVTP